MMVGIAASCGTPTATPQYVVLLADILTDNHSMFDVIRDDDCWQ
jgi:hypothetical protein